MSTILLAFSSVLVEKHQTPNLFKTVIKATADYRLGDEDLVSHTKDFPEAGTLSVLFILKARQLKNRNQMIAAIREQVQLAMPDVLTSTHEPRSLKAFKDIRPEDLPSRVIRVMPKPKVKSPHRARRKLSV